MTKELKSTRGYVFDFKEFLGHEVMVTEVGPKGDHNYKGRFLGVEDGSLLVSRYIGMDAGGDGLTRYPLSAVSVDDFGVINIDSPEPRPVTPLMSLDKEELDRFCSYVEAAKREGKPVSVQEREELDRHLRRREVLTKLAPVQEGRVPKLER